MELDASKTAILALHWQRDIVSSDGRFAPTFSAMADETGVVARTRELFDRARALGVRIVYTRVCFRSGYPDIVVNSPLTSMVQAAGALVDGEPGADIIAELTPATGDLVVSNRAISGFSGSDLDQLLRASAVSTVVLTGVATNVTVLNTAFDAVNLGYRTVVISDCTSATDRAAHDAALATMGLLGEIGTAEELLRALP